MNRSISYLAYFLVISIGLLGCVSQSKYLEMQEQKSFYESAYANFDSLEAVNQDMRQDNQDMEAYLRQAFQEVEKLTVANQSLNRNYVELRKRYDQIAQTNSSVISNSSFEKQNLQEQLAAKQAELDQKEAYLNNLERELTVRQQQLNQAQASTASPSPYGNTNSNNPQLENQIKLVNQQLQNIRQAIGQSFYGVNSNEVGITQENGLIIITMAQSLLFPNNTNDQINNRGLSTLARLAQILNANPEIKIDVEGHTDGDGDPKNSWDRSVIRAASVAKELIALNINPSRITASGKSSYEPVANNNSPQGRLANNRTEIILSPDYNALLNIIQR
jgi:chemotaxis protein MotB